MLRQSDAEMNHLLASGWSKPAGFTAEFICQSANADRSLHVSRVEQFSI